MLFHYNWAPPYPIKWEIPVKALKFKMAVQLYWPIFFKMRQNGTLQFDPHYLKSDTIVHLRLVHNSLNCMHLSLFNKLSKNMAPWFKCTLNPWTLCGHFCLEYSFLISVLKSLGRPLQGMCPKTSQDMKIGTLTI